MSGPGSGSDGPAEGVFAINPEEKIWTLARQLVTGQHTISQLNDSANLLAEANPGDPAVMQHLSQLRRSNDDWFYGALPTLLAAMQVSIEARETFGPGFTRVKDPIDGAVWNHKLGLWRERLSGRIKHDGGYG